MSELTDQARYFESQAQSCRARAANLATVMERGFDEPTARDEVAARALALESEAVQWEQLAAEIRGHLADVAAQASEEARLC